MSNGIIETFGLEPMEPESKKLVRIHSGDPVKDDLDFAREQTYDLIDKGTEALDELINVAKQSQHPRAFEVLSTLLGQLANLNKSLVEQQTQRKEINKEDQPQQQVINNNLHLTTADFLKLINKKTEEENAE